MESSPSATATADTIEKHKSIVDEKLIDNAIKSTCNNDVKTTTSSTSASDTSSNASSTKSTNDDKQHKPNKSPFTKNKFNQFNGNKGKMNGNNKGDHNNYHSTKQGPKYQQQNHHGHYQHQQHRGGNPNNHATNHYKSKSYAPTNTFKPATVKPVPVPTAPISNPVVVYYGDPDVEINVDELLDKQKQQQQQQQNDDKNKSKSDQQYKKQQHYQQNHGHKSPHHPNHHHHHHQQGYNPIQHHNHHPSGNNHNHHNHPAKYLLSNSNNNTKQYSNHYKQPQGNSKQYQPKSNYHNNDNHRYHQPQQPPSAKSNVGKKPLKTFDQKSKQTEIEPTLNPPSNPVVIYYNSPNPNSESKDENGKDSSQQQSDGARLTAEGQSTADDAAAHSDDQTTAVIQTNDDDRKPLNESESAAVAANDDGHEEKTSPPPPSIEQITQKMESTLIKSNNPEDVISGGQPIENFRLPSKNDDDSLKMVRCTIISHPKHFYIKFLNESNERILKQMKQFYSQDYEHIELTMNVLQEGQYYAAKLNDSDDNEWTRIKLLQIESDDHLSCLLIDIGSMVILNLDQLQPLYNQFRSVPKQSIRVALKGIKPPNQVDWLPNEALEFNKLLNNQILKVTNIYNDDNDNCDNNEIWNETIDHDNQKLQICLQFNDDDHSDKQLAGKSVVDVLIERNLAIAI